MSRFRFLTGSYTEQDLVPGSSGEGIQLWELDSETGWVEKISTCPGIANPSWVAVHPGGKYVAAASEQLGGASRTCLLEMTGDGSLRPVDAVASGDATCHLSFSPDGRYLASAAYLGGGVQLMKLNRSGIVGTPQVCTYVGNGPNRERQDAPHAHQVVFSPDGRLLYATDLGTDTIWCHRIEKGCLGEAYPAGRLPAGEGPRHMVVDWENSLVFVLAELTGNLHLLFRDRKTGALEYVLSQRTLPENWDKEPSSSAIRMHPTQAFVHVSNRNGGLLSSFKVDPQKRRLDARGIRQLADPSPRDFHISPDGHWLLVGGQESGRILVHPIDPASGSPGPVHSDVACPSVVCFAWANPEK